MVENLFEYIRDSREETKRENKKKLNKLLDKYGSREGIDKNADVRDSYEYMFANTDNLIDEVEAERLAKNSASYSQLSNLDDCNMIFDGENLELYKNHRKVNSLKAQSGNDNFQSAKYQNIPNKGPIPEGIYYANQDQRQKISLKDALGGTITGILDINRGKWKGGPVSWGLRRVWLKPDVKTNTYGRSGFSIHGGLNKGSAGCIDIPMQTDKLGDYLDDCQETVPIRVKYKKNW